MILKNELLIDFQNIQVPEFGKNIVELDIVKRIELVGSELIIDLVLPTFALRSEQELAKRVKEIATNRVLNKAEVVLNVFADVKPAVKQSIKRDKIADVKNIILILSGKGGVGKSTVAANLALALSKMGCRTGLIDADIYGPSIPTIFAIPKDTQIFGMANDKTNENYMLPINSDGIKLMSIGFLVDTSAAMIWRGPMISSAVTQMFNNTAWGDLDYLIVDMPPGTGDIQLTISQKINTSGALIVSTPQELALADVTRAKAMLDKLKIPIFGLIENMSYFMCDNCNSRHEIFSHGGASSLAELLKIPIIAEIPLNNTIDYRHILYKDLAYNLATLIANTALNASKIEQEEMRLNVLM